MRARGSGGKPSKRAGRILRDALSKGIGLLDDPRIPPDLAVTYVKMGRGGSLAVGVSSSSRRPGTVLHALGAASRYLVGASLAGLRLRRLPKISFVWDDAVEKAFEMDAALRKADPHD